MSAQKFLLLAGLAIAVLIAVSGHAFRRGGGGGPPAGFGGGGGGGGRRFGSPIQQCDVFHLPRGSCRAVDISTGNEIAIDVAGLIECSTDAAEAVTLCNEGPFTVVGPEGLSQIIGVYRCECPAHESSSESDSDSDSSSEDVDNQCLALNRQGDILARNAMCTDETYCTRGPRFIDGDAGVETVYTCACEPGQGRRHRGHHGRH